jgi:hypothetical protein
MYCGVTGDSMNITGEEAVETLKRRLGEGPGCGNAWSLFMVAAKSEISYIDIIQQFVPVTCTKKILKKCRFMN